MSGKKQSTTRSNEHWAESFFARLQQPVDAASIAVFRIGFGVILLVEVIRFFWNTSADLSADRNWIASKYIDPPFHFTYPGFEWVQPLSGPGMYWVFGLLGFCAVCIAAGFLYRFVIALFLPLFLYVFLIEKAEYQNHFYFVLLLGCVLLFVPADGMWSLTARLHPERRRDRLPTWCLWALRLQVAIPYVFGGLAKLQYDWLVGQPMQFWMSRMPLAGQVPGFGELPLAIATSWSGMLLDLLIVPALLWRRTRTLALVAAGAFHLMNATMFHIGIFPWLMLVATTLFLEPSWPRWLTRSAAPKLVTASKPPATWRWTLPLLTMFFVIQAALPFRHWLYPGNVNWTGEGYHFSWRMMLNHPTTILQVFAVDPVSRRAQRIEPLDVGITLRQREMMENDPEMLREFAVWLRQQLREAEQGEFEIHVVAVTTLNGRRPHRQVDASIDLAAQPRRWGAQPWIEPLREPLDSREVFYVDPQYWSRDPSLAKLLKLDAEPAE